jgi:hypothetical protein
VKKLFETYLGGLCDVYLQACTVSAQKKKVANKSGRKEKFLTENKY